MVALRQVEDDTLRSALEAAVGEISSTRPKYPNLSCAETAVKYLSLYLKAHNPRIKSEHIRSIYHTKLTEFKQRCALVDRLFEPSQVRVRVCVCPREGGGGGGGGGYVSLVLRVERANENAGAVFDAIDKAKLEPPRLH